jgi:hypothetical protein
VLGIAFGATGAVFASGDTMHTLRAARAWGANTLRSLERAPASSASVAPSSIATEAAWPAAIAPKNAPCPMEPGPGDPCAELLAPFAANVPTVNIEDLPRVKPPPVAPVVVIARRGHAAPAAAPPVDPEREETQAAPRGVNPDQDDPQATPARVAPIPPPGKPADPPSSQLSSARNEPT